MTKYEYVYDPRQYDPAQITVVRQFHAPGFLVMDGDGESESCPTRERGRVG